MISFQDYFYHTESDVLFVNEDTQRVGILNSEPDYTLDVNGTISASNIITSNILVHDTVIANQLIASSNSANFTEASIADFSNINAISMTASSNVIIGSNLAILNTYLNRNCPVPNNGSLFGFSLGGGWIDPSWLKVDNDWAAFLDSAWNALQTGYDLFTLARSIFDSNDALANDLKDAIGDALSNGHLKVPWGTISSKPLYAGELTKNVGVAGHLYLSKSKIIYTIDETNFSTANPDNNMDLMTSAGRVEVLNLSNQDAFLRNITCSNITTSNLITSNLNASSYIQTPYITSDKVKVGEFYVTNSGIYVGDPTYPLTSQLIIDNQGYYKGTIDRSQIINLEAFSLASAANGQLIWGEFGNTSALNDVFASQTPLYNVG